MEAKHAAAALWPVARFRLLIVLLGPPAVLSADPKANAVWQRVNELQFRLSDCHPPDPRPFPPDAHWCFPAAAGRIRSMARRRLKVYPISFCFPRNIADYYSHKFANLSRSQLIASGRYGFFSEGATRDEGEYMRSYAVAHFVTTKKKAGYDCHRHNEILAAGAIPLFATPEEIDPYTMFHQPKECFPHFHELFAISNIFEVRREHDHSHQYLYDHLTCDSMVRFMGAVTDFDFCTETPVLFIDAHLPVKADYQSLFVLIGLRELLGTNLHVHVEPQYVFRGWTGQTTSLYGNGMGLARLFPDDLKSSGVPEPLLLRRLKAGFYKLVVYGSWTRSSHFFEAVIASLPPYRVWVVHGEDSPPKPTDRFHGSPHFRKATAFIREMRVQQSGCRPLPLSRRPGPNATACLLVPSNEALTLTCLQSSERRILHTRFHYLVFPISFSLPTRRLVELAAYAAAHGTSPRTHHVPLAGLPNTLNRTLHHLAGSKYLGMHHPSELDSLNLVVALALGVTPVTRTLPPFDVLRHFHQPKECFRQNNSTLPAEDLQTGLPAFARRRLSCAAMAQFMLRSVHFDACRPGPILFLDNSTYPSLLSLMTLIGLKEVLGSRVHVVQEPPYLYANWTEPPGGTNWTAANPLQDGVPPPPLTKATIPAAMLDASNAEHFVRVLPTSSRTAPVPAEMARARLAKGQYRAVVYGDFERNRHFLEEAFVIMSPDRIWAVLASRFPLEEGVRYTQFVRLLNSYSSACYQWATGEVRRTA